MKTEEKKPDSEAWKSQGLNTQSDRCDMRNSICQVFVKK